MKERPALLCAQRQYSQQLVRNRIFSSSSSEEESRAESRNLPITPPGQLLPPNPWQGWRVDCFAVHVPPALSRLAVAWHEVSVPRAVHSANH